MQIEKLETNKLIPYVNNSRTHSENQVSQVAASITEFGFNNPILIDKKNTIIAGHGRLLAAQKLGLPEVPCVRLEHLTETQKKAYIIADNKLALNAGWDEELLSLELKGLEEDGFDTSLIGFDEKEMAQILSEGSKDGLTDEDEIPEVNEEAQTKEGDLYQLGNHKLLCGDSTSVEQVERLMGGEKADMVFTDPPYGMNYQSNMRVKTQKFKKIENDDQMLNFIPVVDAFSQGWVFIWTTWKVFKSWVDLCKPLGTLSNVIIWFKGGGGIGDLKKTFSTDYEMALVYNRGAELRGKRIGSVWTVKKDFASNYKHPTQKPVELAVEALEKTTVANNIVLDIFGGSGSTMIACEKANRRCYMMEKDPIYCDVIVKRWEDFTGSKAKLID